MQIGDAQGIYVAMASDKHHEYAVFVVSRLEDADLIRPLPEGVTKYDWSYVPLNSDVEWFWTDCSGTIQIRQHQPGSSIFVRYGAD